jgi:hypothetical protein
MRIAAGILLIILGIVRVANIIINMSVPGAFINSYSLWEGFLIFGYWPVVYGALFITGGILCIAKKYWGLCLISSLLALVGGIYAVAQTLVLGDSISIYWETWILIVGALISTIFISITKKEWQEISDSVDGKVSYGD